jgi:hypothetical protein
MVPLSSSMVFAITVAAFGMGLGACRPTLEANPPEPSSPVGIPRAGSPPAAASSAVMSPAAPSSARAAPEPPAGADDEFLVVTASGDLVLRTAQGIVRVLAESVSSALYDPTLELVWLEGDSLRVVDLRQPGAAPVVIARDWVGTSELSIRHPASSLSNNETCDVGDATSLIWDENPKLERIDEQPRELQLDATDWLRAELHRAAREPSDDGASSLRSEQPRVQLPAGARCDDPDECGRAVTFDASGLQLVLALTLLGDCWHPYCLLHDPTTGAWSSPLLGDRWRGAAGDRAGPCGMYAFDRSGTSFLIGDRLCGPDERCQDLGGEALGWRNPGRNVGAPSDMSMAPDPDSDD